MKAKKKSYTKIALALSLCLMILWGLLGAGTSLAWFTDTTPVLKNVFQIDELALVVSHRLDDGTYEVVDADTAVFDDQALYEPGYVQVVRLKIENKGDIPFDYKTAVRVTDYTPAVNVFGYTFELQDYLKFGVVTADTEAELEAKITDRDLAKQNAVEEMPLNTYTTQAESLDVGGVDYMALIVRMPEEVGNAANHREKDIAPTVELGLIVKASQQGTPIEIE